MKKELLIILILSALVTYLYIWWQVETTVWKLAVGFHCLPGPLCVLSFFQWWYSVEIFIKSFLAMLGAWWVLKLILRKVKKKWKA